MYIGIDVGGTNLKAGLVDESGKLCAVSRIPLDFQSPEQFAKTLTVLALQVMQEGSASRSDIEYVGIGIPGAVQGGNILFTANIPMRNVPLESLFRQHLDLPVLLANDADCAAAGEYLCGAGKGTRDFIVLTLGTGVGGGFILNGKLYTGMGCAGEVGHMVIHPGGLACNCGRNGCLEAYASATGLVHLARARMQQHPESLLHTLAQQGKLEGRTIFNAAQQGDACALSVCHNYAQDLAAGVTDLVNLLHPQVIALGGGVAAAPDDLLLTPVQQYVDTHSYCRYVQRYTRITHAVMGNDAGIVGAALLRQIL